MLGNRVHALADLFCRRSRRTCPIAWQPNALAPVFYGHRDYGAVDGAPTDLRLFFPSLDGSPDSGEMLRGCGRYPLIIFAHGSCVDDTDHYLKWFEVPAQLARAGYVVAVPRLPQIANGVWPSQADDDLDKLRDVISWVRSSWAERTHVAPEPSTGLVGHSFGAGVGGRLAAEGRVTAYAALSGAVTNATRKAVPAPNLFVWGTNESTPPGVDLTDAQWAAVAAPKHRAVIDDFAHWDYLPAGRTRCGTQRGPCGPTWVTWDILTMFFAKYLPPPNVPSLPSQVPDSLVPPLPLTLTTEQTFFIGGWLSGFPTAASKPSGCRITMSWDAAGGSGTATYP